MCWGKDHDLEDSLTTAGRWSPHRGRGIRSVNAWPVARSASRAPWCGWSRNDHHSSRCSPNEARPPRRQSTAAARSAAAPPILGPPLAASPPSLSHRGRRYRTRLSSTSLNRSAMTASVRAGFARRGMRTFPARFRAPSAAHDRTTPVTARPRLRCPRPSQYPHAYVSIEQACGRRDRPS